MIVGGWFDAEDLYGPLETYKGIEKKDKKNYNIMVFGPWDHGRWASSKVKNAVGNYYFGDSISLKFHQVNQVRTFSKKHDSVCSKENIHRHSQAL